MSESLIGGAEPEAAPVEATEPQVEAPAAQEEPTSSDRPEWLPEKYKSPEDLANAYKQLESKLGTKEEDLRNSILEELQADAYKDRPESAGAYELPEIIDGEEAVSSELLQWWSEHAFENGYSQEEFQKGIEMYASSAMGEQVDPAAELLKLGDSANDRIQSASMFANKFFPAETMPAIERMCETADGIMALEHIIEAMKDGSFSGETAPAVKMTESSLREMMQDDRYHHPAKRDRDFIKQVEDGFKALYG